MTQNELTVGDHSGSRRLAVAFAAVVALTLLLIPTQKADAALMDRVNDAVVEAGAPLTVERSNAFQVGVFVGHYKTYVQLVGAVAFHKERGTLPSFTQTKAAVSKTCINGTVTSLSDTGVTVLTDDLLKSGAPMTKLVRIATNQYNLAISRGVKAGENVNLCSTDGFANQYGHMTLI